jgi:WD40 repeat protein
VAFAVDGLTLASGSADKTVKLWDAKTGKEAGTLKGHAGPVNSVAFSPDGLTLASASGGVEQGKAFGEVKLWDVKAGQLRATLLVPARGGKGGEGRPDVFPSVAFTPDGLTLAVAGGDETVKLHDAPAER